MGDLSRVILVVLGTLLVLAALLSLLMGGMMAAMMAGVMGGEMASAMGGFAILLLVLGAILVVVGLRRG